MNFEFMRRKINDIDPEYSVGFDELIVLQILNIDFDFEKASPTKAFLKDAANVKERALLILDVIEGKFKK